MMMIIGQFDLKKNIAVELCCVFSLEIFCGYFIFSNDGKSRVHLLSVFEGFCIKLFWWEELPLTEPDYQILTCGDNVVHFDNEDEGDEDDEDDVVDHHEDDDDDEDEDDGSECFYNELFLC